MTSQHKDLTSQHKDLTRQQKDLTRQQKDLTSQHNYLTSDGRTMPPYTIAYNFLLFLLFIEIPEITLNLHLKQKAGRLHCLHKRHSS